MMESNAPQEQTESVASQRENLAGEALDLVTGSLVMRFRFLDRALRRLLPARPAKTESGSALQTDTRTLYYDAAAVLERFADGDSELVRDVLHTLLHCLFLHPFGRQDASRELWDASCDIVCESMGMKLGAVSFPSEQDEARREVVEELEKELGALSPEKLYFHLRSGAVPPEKVLYYAALFQRDDHALWYPADQTEGEDGSTGMSQAGASDSRGSSLKREYRTEPDTDAPNDGASKDGDPSGSPDDQRDPSPAAQADSEDDWKELSNRVKADLQNNAQHYGSDAGHMTMMLRAATKRRSDYRSFLRRFVRPTEVMHLDPDEFDLIYYKFGIDAYGNLPLIEPLEYREERSIDALAIAVDTSGSVQGELVERFLAETLDILNEADLFKDGCEVRIIQCDAAVQKVTVLHGRDELGTLTTHEQASGFGGTDFRPVFAYLDELLESGEMKNLRGLIYFTDGIGTYPETLPAYDTAFVLPGETPGAPPVPPWAIKVLLNPLDLLAFHEPEEEFNEYI